MSAEKTPKSQLNEKEIRAELEDQTSPDDDIADDEVAAKQTKKDHVRRGHKLQMDMMSHGLSMMGHDLSMKKDYHSWLKWLILLMLVVPGILFGFVVWIIFFSEPTTCPTMGMCEDPGLWTTKNIFVSGSFITLVTFYTVLAKGLFGNNIRDKSLTEQASDAGRPWIGSSGGS